MEIKDYIIRRLMLLVPTMALIAAMTFVLTRLAGSPIAMYVSRYATQDQIARVREIYHLNDPIWVQFLYWARGVLFDFDLGFSHTANMPVTEALLHFAPATFELAVLGVIVATAISVFLGTLAGRYPDTWIDHGSRAFAVGGMSTPQFWAALLLLFLGYVYTGWFPIGRANEAVWSTIAHPTGFYTVDAILAMSPRALGDAIWHLILPALVIGYAESAVITRHLRSEIIEKTREEFVDAARARGLRESTVYNKHIRRNALIPTVTVAGLSFAFLMRGIVVVELVFAWPGLGRWVANAALSGDYGSVMGFILVVAVIVLLINLSVDVLYAYLDPRIELGE
jgi:peptide/nickel transport system permease protein